MILSSLCVQSTILGIQKIKGARPLPGREHRLVLMEGASGGGEDTGGRGGQREDEGGLGWVCGGH